MIFIIFITDVRHCFEVVIGTKFVATKNYCKPKKNKLMPLLKKTEGHTITVPRVFSDVFDVNRFFEDETWLPRLFKKIPAANVKENDKDYTIELAVPGMKKEDFKLEMENNMLTISSEKEENKNETEGKFTRREYNYESFSRSFTLPETVKSEDLKASYENGILKISVPKKEEAKPQNTKKEIKIS